MYQFHNEHDAHMTLRVRQHEIKIEFGVLETNGYNVIGISEKPSVSYLVNSGTYILSPDCLKLVPSQLGRKQLFHMTDLLRMSIDSKFTILSFPIHEY